MVRAVLPSKVVPEAAPAPPLLNVTALVTLPAVLAEPAVVAEDADVAVAALPEILMPQVPVAFAPLVDGAPIVL